MLLADIMKQLFKMSKTSDSGLGTDRNYSFVDFVEDKNVGKYA